MATVAHAMADLALGRITYVAVLSDDSDFISLYTAIRDDPSIPHPEGRVPFLRVVTGRNGPLSATVKRVFPPEAIHIAVTGDVLNENNPDPGSIPPAPPENQMDSRGEMAQILLQTMPPGPFKSTDCQPIIEEHWPDHPIARSVGGAFENEFKNNIRPILKRYGVQIGNPGKKPVRYEMPNRSKGE